MNPPDTARRPVTETHHGVEITDPYRWLEADPDEDDAVATWTDAQNEYTDWVLDHPVRDRLERRFETLASIDEFGPLNPVGDRYFQRYRRAEMEQSVVAVRDAPEADPRVLVDPNTWGEEATDSVDWYAPDETGDRLAYGVSPGGTENYDVYVIDVDTGDEIDHLEETGRTHSLAWTDNGFYYVATGTADADEGGQLEKSVLYHHLGTEQATDRVVLEDVGETTWPGVTTDDDVLIVTLSEGWDRSEVYALSASDPATDSLDLSPVITDTEHSFAPHVANDRLYLLTDHDAPRSRLLSVPIEDALAGPIDPAAATETISESEGVLRGVTTTAAGLVAHYHVDAASKLSVFGFEGDHDRDLAVPELSSVGGVLGDDEGSEISYTIQGFNRPSTVYLHDLNDGESTEIASIDIDVSVELRVRQAWFTSADGTEIPAFVVHREDIVLDGDNPTLLTGYGGFRVNRTPSFNRFALPFFEAGGVYVLATLRGGSEYGEPWHEAGRREHKQRVFDDFIAVAEGLIDRQYTRPKRLAIAGGSNGGLLVGAAMTQRPDLFGAVLCQVPLLDMLRFHTFLLGASWTTEYGHPEDPEDFEYLREYSPYHNVEPADYPATLIATAEGDTRVHPAHARKMTARLQAETTGEDAIALRVRTDTGHGTGKSRSMIVTEQAEQWTFLFRFLDVRY